MKNATVWVDGGSRGNPGPSSIGVVLMDTASGVKWSYRQHIGTTTNNVAEYMALRYALKLAKSLQYDQVFVYSDSKLVVNQVKGLFKINNPNLQALYDEIIQFLPSFKAFHIELIPREQNTQADKLCNEALDELAATTDTK